MLKEYIAFRTKDNEGDIWCEDVFIFENEAEVEEFFKPDNETLLGIFAEEGERALNYFKIHKAGDYINSIEFETEYASKTMIVRMNNGYICTDKIG